MIPVLHHITTGFNTESLLPIKKRGRLKNSGKKIMAFNLFTKTTQANAAENKTTQLKNDILDFTNEITGIFSQINNPLVIINKYGKIEWANLSFAKSCNCSLKHCGGKKIWVIQKTISLNLYKTVLKQKEPLTYVYQDCIEDQRYWKQVELTPILNTVGELERIAIIETDVTSIKNKEHELIISKKLAELWFKKENKAYTDLVQVTDEAEKSIKIKEQFFTYMTHEIRTPVNGIAGVTDLLLATKISSEQREYLGTINKLSDTLLILVNDILDLSKIDAGKINFRDKPFQIQEISDALFKIFYPKAKEKDITLTQECDPVFSTFMLLGDPYRLSQILMNLLSNAIKFTFQHGKISLLVKRKSETKEHIEVEFTVSDTGCGIPENKIDSLFTEFSQAHEDSVIKGGSGLGLVIVKKLTQLQGGEVRIYSKENEGSQFVVTLMFRKLINPIVSKKNILDGIQTGNEQINTLSGIRVLLIDDNSVNQLIGTKLLNYSGASVDLAKDGEIAIKKLQQNLYDILLMDINMPVMNGYQTTKYIREEMKIPPHVLPIIALTAHTDVSEFDKCLKAGMNDCLSKPFQGNELYTKIKKHLIKIQ
jgi:two-component system CheB/CheR fusion protein